MKPIGILITLWFICLNLTVAQTIQPYLLCSESLDAPQTVHDKILQSCEDYSFKFLGEYRPHYAPGSLVLVMTSPDLQGAVKQVGGLTGVTSAWRVIIEQKGDKVQVSYPNPEYWGNAIFQDDFYKVEYSRYMAMSGKLNQLCTSVGSSVETAFGSEAGLTADALQHFEPLQGGATKERTEVLATFASYEEAVGTIDSNFKAVPLGIHSLYHVEMPEQKLKLYGLALNAENSAEITPVFSDDLPANLSFLPIEVLVRDGEVHMLNSHFIVPMIFPGRPMESLSGVLNYYDGMKKLVQPALAAVKD